jgi:hypothetical protein
MRRFRTSPRLWSNRGIRPLRSHSWPRQRLVVAAGRGHSEMPFDPLIWIVIRHTPADSTLRGARNSLRRRSQAPDNRDHNSAIRE